MTISGRTVLVTGGAGFVGSHIAEALIDANDVRVLDNLDGGKRAFVPSDATFLEGDVRDPDAVAEAMADVDLVYHQAAVVSVPESIEQPVTSNQVNVDGALNVLEAARQENARVVTASSAAIYGHPETIPIGEDAPKQPTSPYGLQKLTVDQYTRLYHDLYGLETVAIRPFNAYGPRQDASPYSGVISIFLEQARQGDRITVEGDGEQTRDFVYVEDLVDAYLAAGTTDAVGEAFNVATGTSVSIRELAETVKQVTGSDADVVHTDARAGDITHSRADISKATERLGFEPTFTLRDGLEAFV